MPVKQDSRFFVMQSFVVKRHGMCLHNEHQPGRGQTRRLPDDLTGRIGNEYAPVTSRCNTLKSLKNVKIDRTRAAIYLAVVAFVVLSTTGSYSRLVDQPVRTALASSTVVPTPDTLASNPLALASLEQKNEIQLRPYQLPFVPHSAIDNETLWLARCIYSETSRPEEQELIAWVVRNRVEAGYRGKTTYRQVVLDPYQFSAFNADSPKSDWIRSLNLDHTMDGWNRALTIAYYVRHARPHYRPFSEETLHFYSEQSMVGRVMPHWARGLTPVETPVRYQLDERRFRFYEGIS